MDSMREVGRKYGNTTQEADKGGSSLQSPVPPCGKKKGMVRMSPTSSARQPEKQAIMSTTLKQIDPCNSKPHDTRSPDITASVVIFSIFKLLSCLEGSSAKCHGLSNPGSIDKNARKLLVFL